MSDPSSEPPFHPAIAGPIRDRALEIFNRHVGLAISCAGKYKALGGRIDFEDARQIALGLLWEIAVGYASGRRRIEHAFTSYAHPSVMHALWAADHRERRLPTLSLDEHKLPARKESPTARLEAEEQLAMIADWLRCLHDRPRRIIICRFGLDGQGQRSWDTIADGLAISQTRAKQIYTQAIAKLQRKTAA